MFMTRKLILGPMAGLALLMMAAVPVFACTNYVGDMSVWGDVTGAPVNTHVTVTGNQPFNDPSQAMTQSVDSSVSQATHSSPAASTTCSTGASAGCLWVYTAQNPDAAHGLGAATYDLNFINIGYSNHTTWLNPSGDCMSWRVPSAATKIGTVTVGSGTGGKITSATKADGVTSVTVTNNIAGPFAVPASQVRNASPQEAGVCVSSGDSVNGNQAPLTLV